MSSRANSLSKVCFVVKAALFQRNEIGQECESYHLNREKGHLFDSKSFRDLSKKKGHIYFCNKDQGLKHSESLDNLD